MLKQNFGFNTGALFLVVIALIQVTTCTMQCSDFVGKTIRIPPRERRFIDSVEITGATFFPATGSIPGYCQVTGKIDNDPNEAGILNFQVRMPDNWQGRFVHAGNGGNAGFIAFYGSYEQPFDFIDPGSLKLTTQGYANAACDMGTSGGPDPLTPEITEQKNLLSFLGVHLSTVISKEIIEMYYYDRIDYSYFSGCSLGGLSAFMEVTMFPYDFDGIVAQDATHDTIRYELTTVELLKANNLPGPNEYVDRATLEAAYDLAVAKCGDANGLIQNGYRCEWDPAVDLAPLNLNADQLNFFQKLYSNFETDDGEFVHFGYAPGCERDLALWFANDPRTQAIFGVGAFAESQIEFWRNWAFGNLSLEYEDISINDFEDIDSDYDSFNAGTKFRRYLASGNKLMVLSNGGSGIYPQSQFINDWSNRIMRRPNSRIARNYRHYIVPNSGHCGVANDAFSIVFQANTTSTYDPIPDMIRWVEQNEDLQMIHTKTTVNQIDFSVCPYPKENVDGSCVDKPLVKFRRH